MAVKTNREIKKIVKEYSALLLEEGLPVEKIILFGSYALKKATENSDIDIAVILSEIKEDRFTERLKLMKFCRDFDAVIEPHPFVSNEFDAENPFAFEIMNTGIEIYHA